MNKIIYSIFLIASTIIGLGIFILPYALSKSGIYFWIWFLIVPILMFLVHLSYSEIIFQVEEKHNLPGLAEKILGKNYKNIVWIIDFIGNLLVFISYYLALSNFTKILIPIDNDLFIKIFYALLVILIIFFSTNPFAKVEFLLGLLMVLIFLFLGFYFLPKTEFSNFKIEFLNPWLSYGILVFAFTGYSSLQMVYDLIGKNKNKMLIINLISIFLISLLYLIFTASIYGVFGKNVSPTILENLKNIDNKIIPISVAILAILNIFTTFIALAFYLKRGLQFDYKIKHIYSWLIVSFFVLILTFLNLADIAKLVSLIGSIFLGFNLFILLLCYLRLKEYQYFKIPKFLIIILMIILILGIGVGIISEYMGG